MGLSVAKSISIYDQSTMRLQSKLTVILLTSHIGLFFNGRTECAVIGPDGNTSNASTISTRIPPLNRNETTKNNSTSGGDICGVSDVKPNVNARIIGGVEAIPNSWPWQASLRYKSCNLCHECGATLLYSDWVITAAHCVYELHPSGLRVILGDHNQHRKEGTEQHVQVSQVIIHQKYNHSSLHNDIALLRLSFPVEFNRYIKPICLPTRDVDDGTQCIVTGWGDTRGTGSSARLNQVSVPILHRAHCNKATWYHGTVMDSMVCAGFAGGRKDSCHGDSGGPLVCLTEDDRWTLDGVTSWGEGCAHRHYPGIYVRIAKYLTWIRSKTEVSV